MKYAGLLMVVAGLVIGQGGAMAKGRVAKWNRTVQPYRIAYYPALKWRVTLGMRPGTTPAVADLDLDGSLDLIIPAADENTLYRLDGSGAVKWKYELPAPATAGVTLGDVDRDGSLDVLVAAGRTLLCIDAEGKERWRYEVPRSADSSPAQPAKAGEAPAGDDEDDGETPPEIADKPAPEEKDDGESADGVHNELDEIHSQPVIADLDADGSPEVLFGANDNCLHVLTGHGKEKWTYRTKSWITGGVALANINGDKRLEIVFGSMDYNIYCLDSQGTLAWKYETSDWVQCAPALGDVDGDGNMDILAASDDGQLYCLSRLGTLQWQHELGQKQHMKPYLALADLDMNGTLETLASTGDGVIEAVTADGQSAWRRTDYGKVVAAPLIADLNGNGWPDILLATTAGQLIALDNTGNQQWNYSTGQGIQATPAIADLDKDGQWEIYVGTMATDSDDSGFFSQLELSTPGGKGVWAALQGDAYRTGYVSNARDYGNALKRGGDYSTAWAPFFDSTRPRTKLLPPRRIKVTALPLDDVRGNHDGALDPGETALLRVRVENQGRGASYETSLALDMGESPLRVDRRQTYLGWLPAGATKTITYRITAPPLKELLQMLEEERAATFRDIAAPPSTIPMASATLRPPLPPRPRRIVSGWQNAKLSVTESGNLAAQAQTRVFNVPPLPPILKIAASTVQDGIGAASYGNANGALDSGESVVLRLVVNNAGLSTAPDVNVGLVSRSSDVLAATTETSMRGLVPGGGRTVLFSLRVARKVQNKEIRLALKTSVPTGQGGTVLREEEFRLPLKQSPLDVRPPDFRLLSPAKRIVGTKANTITITGIVDDASDVAAFQFATQAVPLSSLKKLGPNRYQFSFQRPLSVGENVFNIGATDKAGNTSSFWVRVVRRPA